MNRHTRALARFSAAFFIAALSVSASRAASSAAPSRALTLGDSNEDVILLQIELNQSPDTRIAESGPGSPGNETGYFGAKTLDAVKRFQAKYAADVLLPLGLAQPTGFVGEATLKKLRSLSASAGDGGGASQAASSQAVSVAPAPTAASSSPAAAAAAALPWTADMQVPAGVEPNSINLEYAIAQIKELGKQQGRSSADLLAMESAIRTEAATTTDLRKAFFAGADLKAARESPPALDAFSSAVQRALISLGFVRVAQAAGLPGVPFGGALLYALPCSCAPGNWLLTIQPLPPSFATELSYTSGSQLFASYNIPATTHLLGYYAAGTLGCWYIVPHGCAPYPSWGHIMPFVGSSGSIPL